MKSRIIVAGAGYSGALAAVRAAKLGGDQVEVVLVNDRTTFIERIRLHEEAVHGRSIRWPLKDLLRGTGVSLRRGMVLAVDPLRHVLILNDGELSYDKLILALGSTVDQIRLPPGAREHALTLGEGTTADIGRRLRSLFCRSVAVCGGGLVGVELAGEIAAAMPDRRVALITEGEIAPISSPNARAKLRTLLRQAGVTIVEHTRVDRVEADRVIADRSITHDLCIVAPGMRASPVAGRSGFTVNPQGQVLVDRYLRAVGCPDVYAVGDAAFAEAAPGSRLAMGCKYGMPMAAQAAWNAVASLKNAKQQVFDFEDTHFAVSVGRRRALVQLNKPDVVLTGRLAVLMKELINRSALWSIRWERFRWFDYPYIRTGRLSTVGTDELLPVGRVEHG